MNWLNTMGIIGAAILVLISGCAKETEKEEKITIEFMNWESSPVGRALIEDLIRKFEEKYPDVKVKNNVTPGFFSNKVLTRFAGGNPPDIWECGDGRDAFIKRGLMLNPAPYVKKSKLINDEDFFFHFLKPCRYDGEELLKGNVYIYPKDICPPGLIYNKDLFDKEDLSYPDESWTEREFLEAAMALTKRDERGRLVQLGIEGLPNPLDILVQKGGRIWSEDYKRCLLNSQKAKEAFQYWYDLQEKYKVTTPTQEAGQGQPAYVDKAFGFVTGKVGMSIIPRYQMPDMLRDIGEKFGWDVAPVPCFGKERLYTHYGGTGWAISSKTKYPQECFQFLEILVGPEGQMATGKAGWGFPTNKKIAYSDICLNNLNHPNSRKINMVFLEGIDKMKVTKISPYVSSADFYRIYLKETDRTFIKQEGGDVGPVLERLTKRLNEAVARNLRK